MSQIENIFPKIILESCTLLNAMPFRKYIDFVNTKNVFM